MRKRYTVDLEELERLKKEVENFICHPLSSPDDFERLAATLKKDGCGYVSPTTLKRVWGYIKDTGEDYSPSAYTLRALCTLIGFKDMEEFSASAFPIQSKEYTGKFIESRLLPMDAKVILMWQPNRRCVLKHITATLFEVIEVTHSRLQKNDFVECGSFTQHAPAYFSRIFRKGVSPMTYIAGSSNGITFIVVNPPTVSVDDEATDCQGNDSE